MNLLKRIINWLDFFEFFSNDMNPTITVRWVIDFFIILAVVIIFICVPIFYGIRELDKYFCRTHNYQAVKALGGAIDLLYTVKIGPVAKRSSDPESDCSSYR